ncbi:MAG: hypothetical protein Q8Q41_02020 [bacterium]|nr:hypothetical protein [bacterium]
MKTGFGVMLAILLFALPLWASFAMEGHGTAGAHGCPLAPQASCPQSIGILEAFLFHAWHVHGLTLAILTLFVLSALVCAVFARNKELALSSEARHAGQFLFASDPLNVSTRKFTRWLSLREHSPTFA